MSSRAVRLALVTLAAAAGGSACGAALLVLPLALFGTVEEGWFPAVLIFGVSLPFTLTGTALLAGLALLWRDSLSGRWSDYGGIVLAAVPVGAVMPLPFFGAAGLFFGAVFGALTAALWAALYTRFALPAGLRELDHG